MKRILITGGAGFLASHICDQLIARGHKVICLDNFITGKKENIAQLLKDKNFTFIKQDVSRPFKVAGEDRLHHALRFSGEPGGLFEPPDRNAYGRRAGDSEHA